MAKKSDNSGCAVVSIIVIGAIAAVPKEAWIALGIVALIGVVLYFWPKSKISESTPTAVSKSDKGNRGSVGISQSVSVSRSVTAESCWCAPEVLVNVGNYALPGGAIYLGEKLSSVAGYDIEPALINPKLKVEIPSGYEGPLEYWPSYSRISPSARGVYLEWLAGGRKDPNIEIGYVFLFFYGLERRLLADNPADGHVERELPWVRAEVARLRSIYGSASRSFRGYLSIVQHLFQVLRGANNLVFPNSRRNVELYADLLRRKCEQLKVPNEFWPHHGSLSKEIREEAEAVLKKGERPSSAICTTTLELGIDIGAVKSIAQIGCPPSVASMRQRLGRSGRRGEAAILRVYALESDIGPNSPLNDRLRVELVQIVAMIGLLLQGWYEPPRINGLHLSTLVQQVLSIIAQRGGATAGQLWQIFCEGGPFSQVTKGQLMQLLRQLGEKDFLVQQDDGLLLHGVVGERVVNHYSFYASFVTDEEFRVVTGGRALGTLPVSRPIAPDSFIIFAGRRWKVRTVDQERKVIDVIPAGGGKPPMFDGGGGMVHDKIREEMLAIYQGDNAPSFLDATALELLGEARSEFGKLGINGAAVFDAGKDVLLFAWKGDWIQDTLALMLKSAGLSAINEGVVVRVYNASREEVDNALRHLLDNPPQASELADFSFNKYREKWDGLLPEELINKNYATAYLDVTGALSVIETLI